MGTEGGIDILLNGQVYFSFKKVVLGRDKSVLLPEVVDMKKRLSKSVLLPEVVDMKKRLSGSSS